MTRYLPLILAACAVSCQTASKANLPVHHDGLKTERATAVNLRVESGVFLESSNLLSVTPQISAGTPARISKYTKEGVDIVIRHTTYSMKPATGSFDDSPLGIESFIDKYFVSSPEELDYDKLGPATLTPNVKVGDIHKGMTKEQIYVSLGPPRWIDSDPRQETIRISKAKILKSDRWTYAREYVVKFIPRTTSYVFEQGKLIDIE